MSVPDYPWTEFPRPGERRCIRPGLDWVRHPLPFALDHVNCWIIGESGSSWLVDTGVANHHTKAYWQQILSAGKQPDTLLVTHFHPDHMGLAGWFAEQGMTLFSTSVEIALGQKIWHLPERQYAEKYADWYRTNGIAEADVAIALQTGNSYQTMVCEPPKQWKLLSAGNTTTIGSKVFQVLTGHGHAPDMIMLFCEPENLLIAADQVLPRISPNVSLMPFTQDRNPLRSFLESLKELRSLPADVLVLPSHGLPFKGLHDRIDALAEHHERRCEDILNACGSPLTATELFPLLFKRPLDAQQLSFALGESLAHLRYLTDQSLICEERMNGVQTFVTTA